MIQKEVRFSFRLTSKLKRNCETAAERAGMTLSDWARGVLALAAHQGAFAPPKWRTGHGRKKKGGATK